MKTFKVTLIRTTQGYCDVEVQAEDEWDARDKALDLAWDGGCDWTDSNTTDIYPKEPEELEPYDPRNEPDYE
jgi:hypothetical protein